ncbi:hypothetical protein EV130_1421, partial [Rhizobium azibense]
MHAFRAVFLGSAVFIGAVPSLAVTALAQQQQVQPASSEGQFRIWLKTLEAAGAKVTTGSIQYDANSDLAKIGDLVIAWPAGAAAQGQGSGVSTELKIGSLSLKAFTVGGDGVRFTAADANDIRISNTNSPENGGLTLSHLELSNVFLPALTAFKPDVTRPVSSQISFLRLLSKATINTITADDAHFGADFSIDHVTLTGISEGKISKAELNGTRAALPPLASPDEGRSEFSSTAIVLDNTNLDPYLRLFEASAYLEAGSARAWNNLIDKVSVTGARVERGALSASFDKVTLEAFKVRQFEQNITDIFDRAALDPSYISQNPEAANRLSAAIRGSFAFESAGVSKADVAIPTQSGVAKIGLEAGSLSNLTASHLDRASFDTLSYADAGGSFELRRLDLNGVNLPVQPTTVDPASQPVAAALPTVGGVTAAGLDARIGAAQFGFEKFDLAMSYFIGATPTNVKAAVDHLKFVVDQVTIPGLRDTLVNFGYKDVDLSLRLSGAWRDSASAVAFDNIALTGAAMGTLSLSGSLTGITRQSFQNPRTVLPAEASAGGVQNLRISFQNDSLFERFISEVARQNGKTEDELKRILSTNMAAILAQIESPATRNKFTLAAVSFINNPKIFEVMTTTSAVTP